MDNFPWEVQMRNGHGMYCIFAITRRILAINQVILTYIYLIISDMIGNRWLGDVKTQEILFSMLLHMAFSWMPIICMKMSHPSSKHKKAGMESKGLCGNMNKTKFMVSDVYLDAHKKSVSIPELSAAGMLATN